MPHRWETGGITVRDIFVGGFLAKRYQGWHQTHAGDPRGVEYIIAIVSLDGAAAGKKPVDLGISDDTVQQAYRTEGSGIKRATDRIHVDYDRK